MRRKRKVNKHINELLFHRMLLHHDYHDQLNHDHLRQEEENHYEDEEEWKKDDD